MALTNFLADVWSKKLLKIFDKSVVMANLVNRDYEGDISNFGDTVFIRTFGDVTNAHYTHVDIRPTQARWGENFKPLP